MSKEHFVDRPALEWAEYQYVAGTSQWYFLVVRNCGTFWWLKIIRIRDDRDMKPNLISVKIVWSIFM